MRRLLVFAMIALSNLSLSAQDIIKLKNGEGLRVKVLKVTPSYVEYSYPNEDAVIQIRRKKIASIHYESGRVEEFVPPKSQLLENETSKETNASKGLNSPLAKKQMFYVKAGVALNKIHFYDANYSINPMGDLRRFKTGEALDLGYSRYIKDSKFYWAAELGLTTRGCYYDIGDVYLSDMEDLVIKGCYQYTIHHGIRMTPVIFGYRFMLPRDFAIDLRLGGYFAYYYAGKKAGTAYDLTLDNTYCCNTWNDNINDDNYDPYFKMQRRYNAGFETGIAFWYKRFCFDFTYNVGFVSYERTAKQPMDMPTEEYLDALYGNSGNLKWEVLSKNYNYNIQFKLGIAF